MRVDHAAIKQLEREQQIAAALEPVARQILARARTNAPSWIDPTWRTSYGVSARGAYAQVIASGSGTVLAEFGGRGSPPHAYLRRAL